MFSGNLSNSLETLPSIWVWPIQFHHYFCSMEAGQTIYKQCFLDYFLYYNCHCQLVLNFRNASRNLFDMCNKVLSLNFDMGNPNPSLFLGNILWKLVKQYKNSDF